MHNETRIETSSVSAAPRANPVHTVIPIDQLERPTAADFDRYAAAAKPFVIKRAAEHWKALSAWTPDYLKAQAGAARVPVLKMAEGNPDGKFFYGDNTADTMSFGDCLPLLDGAPPRFYMAGVPIAEHLPILAEDLERFDFVDENRQGQSQIWISGKNSKGPLHLDLDDNIHVVIAGRKRFLMFDYAQSPNLYPCPAFSATPHYGLVDAHEPNLDRFPRFRLAAGYDVILEPGDMVYIPQGCWHQVIIEEPSLALNYWLGKRYFDRAMWRILVNLAVRFAAGLVAAPWRAMAGPRSASTMPR